jgi:signal transduction histidine kinase
VRKRVIGALTIAALVIMATLRVMDLSWSRAEILTAAEQRAANLALILAEYISGSFAAGDAALRQLTLHSRRVGGPGAPDAAWAPILASARAGVTGIGAISIIDGAGVIRHSTRRDIIGQSRRDEYQRMQPLGPGEDNLLVGPPFRSPIDPSIALIPIARKLEPADGTFDGAVVASFMPAEPRRFFQSIDVGARGALSVIHPTGAILFREPSTTDPIGESARDNPIFAAASKNVAPGTLRAPIADGGAEMISAFHTTEVQPLILAVSLDQGEVLAHWRRELMWSISVFGVATVLLGATLFVLFRQMDAKSVAEAELVRARQAEADRLRGANEQLAATLEREQQARREAESANAVKDQFLMTVSHELRTPLTAIAGWARLLVDGMVSDTQRESALKTIERNAQAQTRLIEDLLDVSGIMTGKLRLDRRRVQVGDVVQVSVEAVRPVADAKQVTLVAEIAPDTGFVSADTERLQQIVWNLLSNAVKFTPSGGRVTISSVRIDETVQVAVSDTGLGITPEFLPHVFDRFRQGESSASRRHGGLGLGLAIVRSLVELHGGTVTAESKGQGRGATFTVRLPAPIRRMA